MTETLLASWWESFVRLAGEEAWERDATGAELLDPEPCTPPGTPRHGVRVDGVVVRMPSEEDARRLCAWLAPYGPVSVLSESTPTTRGERVKGCFLSLTPTKVSTIPKGDKYASVISYISQQMHYTASPDSTPVQRPVLSYSQQRKQLSAVRQCIPRQGTLQRCVDGKLLFTDVCTVGLAIPITAILSIAAAIRTLPKPCPVRKRVRRVQEPLDDLQDIKEADGVVKWASQGGLLVLRPGKKLLQTKREGEQVVAMLKNNKLGKEFTEDAYEELRNRQYLKQKKQFHRDSVFGKSGLTSSSFQTSMQLPKEVDEVVVVRSQSPRERPKTETLCDIKESRRKLFMLKRSAVEQNALMEKRKKMEKSVMMGRFRNKLQHDTEMNKIMLNRSFDKSLLHPDVRTRGVLCENTDKLASKRLGLSGQSVPERSPVKSENRLPPFFRPDSAGLQPNDFLTNKASIIPSRCYWHDYNQYAAEVKHSSVLMKSTSPLNTRKRFARGPDEALRKITLRATRLPYSTYS